MSTSSVTTDLAIKPYNEDYRVYAVIAQDGKIDATKTKFTTSGKDGKLWSNLDSELVSVKDAEGNIVKDDKGNVVKVPLYTQAVEVTVRGYKVATEEGFAELIPDADERINMINQAIAAKLNRKLGATLKEVDDAGTNFVFDPATEASDGIFDTLPLLREATQRRSLTEQEKQLRALKVAFPTMDESVLLATLQALMNSGALQSQVAEEAIAE
jgi:hypothetical protein